MRLSFYLCFMVGEGIVNASTDLNPLCPNCHAMIHRRKQAILSVEDLRT